MTKELMLQPQELKTYTSPILSPIPEPLSPSQQGRGTWVTARVDLSEGMCSVVEGH